MQSEPFISYSVFRSSGNNSIRTKCIDVRRGRDNEYMHRRDTSPCHISCEVNGPANCFRHTQVLPLVVMSYYIIHDITYTHLYYRMTCTFDHMYISSPKPLFIDTHYHMDTMRCLVRYILYIVNWDHMTCLLTNVIHYPRGSNRRGKSGGLA